MQFIPQQTAESLFEQVEETLENAALKPAERIPKYRTIFECLFKELTADIKQHLGGLHARTAFVFGEYGTPQSLQIEADGLRKTANSVLHDKAKKDPSVSDDLNCLSALCQSIAYFGKTVLP